jgi:hypothetical protein
VVEAAVFWIAVGRLVVVIDSGAAAGVMAKVRAAVAVFAGVPESVTIMVALKVPATVGVPERVPLDVPSASPTGSDPVATLQVYGATPPEFCKV